MAAGIETGGDSLRVRRKVTLKHVLAVEVKDIPAMNPCKPKRPPVLPGGREDNDTTMA
jgi:hypothetical protein